MNRTDRLLAIVLELQGRGRQRGEDLAATFEVSQRTIYRDIQALCEAGVPVVAVPGQGYSLFKGYFLPPLQFSSDEAVMLLLGSDVMAQNFDAEYHLAARSAERKIAGVLPEDLRKEVGSLRQSIRFIVAGALDHPTGDETLRQLRTAIFKRQRVRFSYHARHTREGAERQSNREADPYGLVHIGNSWYMVGHCHERRAIRHFRIERIEALEVLDKTFTRPEDFKIEQREGSDPRNVTVKVLFDAEVTRWVREAPSFYTVSEEEQAEGLLVTLKVRQEREALQWVLGWGAHARVLEPESLRRLVADEAESMLRQYKESGPLLT